MAYTFNEKRARLGASKMRRGGQPARLHRAEGAKVKVVDTMFEYHLEQISGIALLVRQAGRLRSQQYAFSICRSSRRQYVNSISTFQFMM